MVYWETLKHEIFYSVLGIRRESKNPIFLKCCNNSSKPHTLFFQKVDNWDELIQMMDIEYEYLYLDKFGTDTGVVNCLTGLPHRLSGPAIISFSPRYSKEIIRYFFSENGEQTEVSYDYLKKLKLKKKLHKIENISL